jgi:GH18 family chitinase
VDNNCDGIELDWEFPSSADGTGWHNLITKFRTALDALTPHGILITSGYYAHLGNPPYNVTEMNANVDYIVPMTYTMWMGAGSGPFKSGYDTPVNLPSSSLWPTYVGYSLSDPPSGGPLSYLTNGYTASKVAVSVSFESTWFAGVTGMGQAYSDWRFGASVDQCLSAGYESIPATTRYYDSVAKAAYCINGTKIYSYQTPQTAAEIVNWGRANGFGAAMVYDLGVGYEAKAGTPDPQALLHAVATAAGIR